MRPETRRTVGSEGLITRLGMVGMITSCEMKTFTCTPGEYEIV